MFEAINKGCKVIYGRLTPKRIKSLLSSGNLIQISIHLEKMFPDKKSGFHSILIYGYSGNEVFFHDPDNGKSLNASFLSLMNATTDVGAAIVYDINLK